MNLYCEAEFKYFLMKYLIRPLTKKMVTDLRNGRFIELSSTGRNICNTDDFKGSLPGLYKRGFVNTQMQTVQGKEILTVYITREGITFLEKFHADDKRPQEQAKLSG